MSLKTGFNLDILRISDMELTCKLIVNKLKSDVFEKLHRHGGVVGISGGIDSSVSLALAVKAFGPENVLGLIMPDKDSSPDSASMAHSLAEKFNIRTITEDITGALIGLNCYKRRDEAVKNAFPDYDPATCKMKIGIKTLPGSKLPPVFSVFVYNQDGIEQSKKLSAYDYLQIVAASNFKQRLRMSILYYHAERLHYAVIGTSNKHEFDQGFFVKYGDGGVDIMPIVHFYKTQVYQLAEYIGIPREIILRTPTTDTYSAEQTQEEFFYQLPFQQMDLLWYAFENEYDPSEVALVMKLSKEEVLGIFQNFERKRKTTEYLRLSPIRDF